MQDRRPSPEEPAAELCERANFAMVNIVPPADAVNILDALRFRHLVSRLHAAGPRPTGELLARLTRLEPSITASLLRVLEEFASVDVETIKRMGADRWPPAVFAVPDAVRSGRANRE